MHYPLGAAVLLALLVSACGGKSDSGGDDGGLKSGAFSLFDPIAASATVPFPFDGFYSGFSDPTLNIPNASNAPFVTQANLQDGFSTTASIFTDLLGPVDFATLNQGLRIINSANGAVLQAGVDYTVQPSVATAVNPLSGQSEPINQFRSRVLIEPLKPLAPSTRYIVVLTDAIKSTDGLAAKPSELFTVVRSGTPVAEQTVPVLQALSPTQKATLEALRTQLIRPIVTQLGAFGIAESSIVLTWSFTTQSINNTLQKIENDGVVPTLAIRNTGLNLSQLNPALPPIADVYAGTVTLPYYLKNASASPTDPLTKFWLADATQPDTTKSFLGQVPCGAFAAGVNGFQPSVSTTLCFPQPLIQSNETLPVLVTLPNANSGRTMPESGWPVVVFQHGITRNRSDMLAVAPALALAGFAVVAIDLPLHGILPTDATAGLRIPGVSERTFDLDLVNNTTGAAGPDAAVDASGTHFINLSSLITSRDNLRQGVADLIHLSKALPGTVILGGDSLPNGMSFDGSQRRYVGHSLGAIVVATFLGLDSSPSAATLANGGGGIAKLLDASKTFGPRIAAGLAGNGLIEGSDNYETYQRFAQTLVDSADPLNYAAQAAANHPIHFLEVINDLVVPNTAPAGTASATQDRVTIAGYLSGTEPLIEAMGLAVQGPLAAPVATPNILLGPAARNNAVQFSSGDHSSILSPVADPAVTTEMQREMASFLGSNGLCLPIGGACP